MSLLYSIHSTSCPTQNKNQGHGIGYKPQHSCFPNFHTDLYLLPSSIFIFFYCSLPLTHSALVSLLFLKQNKHAPFTVPLHLLLFPHEMISYTSGSQTLDALETRGGLVKIYIAGSHSQSFWFIQSTVGCYDLHSYQVTKSCWRYWFRDFDNYSPMIHYLIDVKYITYFILLRRPSLTYYMNKRTHVPHQFLSSCSLLFVFMKFTITWCPIIY